MFHCEETARAVIFKSICLYDWPLLHSKRVKLFNMTSGIERHSYSWNTTNHLNEAEDFEVLGSFFILLVLSVGQTMKVKVWPVSYIRNDVTVVWWSVVYMNTVFLDHKNEIWKQTQKYTWIHSLYTLINNNDTNCIKCLTIGKPCKICGQVIFLPFSLFIVIYCL